MAHSSSETTKIYTQPNIEKALEFARKSPYPEPEELFEDMWSTPIPQP